MKWFIVETIELIDRFLTELEKSVLKINRLVL